MTQQPFIYPE